MLGPRIAQVINNRKNQHQKTGPGLRFQFRICIYRTPGKDTLCFLSAVFFGTAKLSGNLRESGKRPLESFLDFFMPSAARKLPFSHAFSKKLLNHEKVPGVLSRAFPTKWVTSPTNASISSSPSTVPQPRAPRYLAVSKVSASGLIPSKPSMDPTLILPPSI